MMPWEQFLQLALIAFFLLGIGALVLMYLDGYWNEERRRERWNRTHFTKYDSRDFKVRK